MEFRVTLIRNSENEIENKKDSRGDSGKLPSSSGACDAELLEYLTVQVVNRPIISHGHECGSTQAEFISEMISDFNAADNFGFTGS